MLSATLESDENWRTLNGLILNSFLILPPQIRSPSQTDLLIKITRHSSCLSLYSGFSSLQAHEIIQKKLITSSHDNQGRNTPCGILSPTAPIVNSLPECNTSRAPLWCAVSSSLGLWIYMTKKLLWFHLFIIQYWVIVHLHKPVVGLFLSPVCEQEIIKTLCKHSPVEIENQFSQLYGWMKLLIKTIGSNFDCVINVLWPFTHYLPFLFLSRPLYFNCNYFNKEKLTLLWNVTVCKVLAQAWFYRIFAKTL